MTSFTALRQEALPAIFHDGFWNRDHDCLIVIHSNHLSGIHGFQDNEIILPVGYDTFVIYLREKLLSDQDFMIVIHSNFLSAMHGFRDNVILLDCC